MAKKTSGKKIATKVILVFLLGMSGIGFLIVKHLSDKHFKMPGYYVVERINRVTADGHFTADTVFHRMNDFAMTNQVMGTVTRAALEGKVTLVAFFYTRDTTLAPGLTATLSRVQHTFARSDSGLHILAVTTDPAYDTPAVLKAYADSHGVNHDVWWFLRGAPGEAAEMAKTDFGLQPVDTAGSWVSPRLVLLDKQQYVRGYYRVTDSTDMIRCVTAVSMLMLEAKKDH